jgi:hypothetical protein
LDPPGTINNNRQNWPESSRDRRIPWQDIELKEELPAVTGRT